MNFDPRFAYQRDPRGVIAAILQLGQPLQQQRCRRLPADKSHNSTHTHSKSFPG